LAVLDLAIMLLLNLVALLVVPKFTTPEAARETLPFYAPPILWAGYLVIVHRKSWLRWVAYIAALPALIWLLAVIADIRLVLSS
jgi:hypothetical protein